MVYFSHMVHLRLIVNQLGGIFYFPTQNVYFPTQMIFMLHKVLYINM